MKRNDLRRALTGCVATILLLPLLIAVVVGLGALLGALGDAAAAAVCGRVALALGALLVTAIGAATAVNALALLAPPPHRRPGRRVRRRRPAGVPPEGRLGPG